ncbi:MAG: hypothetical protein R2856_34355 [Caldilineaceae bacterium]
MVFSDSNGIALLREVENCLARIGAASSAQAPTSTRTQPSPYLDAGAICHRHGNRSAHKHSNGAASDFDICAHPSADNVTPTATADAVAAHRPMSPRERRH